MAISLLMGCADPEAQQVEDDSPSDSSAATETPVDSPADTPVDSPADTPVDSAVDTGPTLLPACPNFSQAVRAGTTPLFVVTEASGLAASRRNNDVLWTHNDSGSDPEVYAFTPALTGGLLGTFPLAGATAVDWEDIAVGPGPDASLTYLYVADIGDNGGSRNAVQVYRVAEPRVVASGGPFQGQTLRNVERFDFVYPNGSRDAEAMMVDPLTGDLYIVVKSGSGTSPVYRATAPLVAGTTQIMTEVAVLQFGGGILPGDPLVTGADITSDGSEIAIRTYDAAFAWRRVGVTPIADALQTTPCSIPQAAEGQGEAIGYWADGQGYYTVGEGSATWVNRYTRR